MMANESIIKDYPPNYHPDDNDSNNKNNNDSNNNNNNNITPHPSKKSKRCKDTQKGGIVAILNLPTGTSFSLNGTTRILASDSFVGIKDIYYSKNPDDNDDDDANDVLDNENDGEFHLVVIRKPTHSSSSSSSSSMQNGGMGGAATAFLIYPPPPSSSSSDNSKNGCSWSFIREYNPQTEEPNPKPPADTLTTSNLVSSITSGSTSTSISPRDVISYSLFASSDGGGGGSSSSSTRMEQWKTMTNFISKSLLLQRKLKHGMKLLPAGYSNDDDDDNDYDDIKLKNNNKKQKDQEEKEEEKENDGTEVFYPPIPCLHPSLSLHLQKHVGTRQFLSSLSPSERNYFFVHSSLQKDVNTTTTTTNTTTTTGGKILNHLLERYYERDWKDLVGDLQLSFVLFLYMGCLSSLEHWRDIISMLSFTSSNEVTSNIPLYNSLLQLLTVQLSFIEHDFFEEVEYSGGNFLIPALQRLCSICSISAATDTIITTTARDYVELERSVSNLANMAYQRFKVRLSTTDNTKQGRSEDDDDDDEDEEEIFDVDMENGVDISTPGTKQKRKMGQDGNGGNTSDIFNNSDSNNSTTGQTNHGSLYDRSNMGDDYDEDDEDGPTIVSSEEIEASLARSAAAESQQHQHQHSHYHDIYSNDNADIQNQQQQQKQYPLLYAAMTPQEDIVMTCARVLDEAVDVSLVREASMYLEEVEAFRGRNMIE